MFSKTCIIGIEFKQVFGCWIESSPEAYSGTYNLAKNYQLFSQKSFIMDVLQGPKYASAPGKTFELSIVNYKYL